MSIFFFNMSLEGWFFLGILAYVLMMVSDRAARKNGKKLLFGGRTFVKVLSWPFAVIVVALGPFSFVLAIIEVLLVLIIQTKQQK